MGVLASSETTKKQTLKQSNLNKTLRIVEF